MSRVSATEILGAATVEQAGTPGSVERLTGGAISVAPLVQSTRGHVLIMAAENPATGARAISFAHDGYAIKFKDAATRWVSKGRPWQRIVQHDDPSLTSTAAGSVTVEAATSDCVVLVASATPFTNVDYLCSLLRRGASLVVFACPWGYAQIHRVPSVQQLPHQKILAIFDMRFADAYAEAPYRLMDFYSVLLPPPRGAVLAAPTPATQVIPPPPHSIETVLGVATLDAEGIPGGVAVVGAPGLTVTALAVTQTKQPVAIAAVSESSVSGARALAMAHDGYAAKFLQTAARWLQSGPHRPFHFVSLSDERSSDCVSLPAGVTPTACIVVSQNANSVSPKRLGACLQLLAQGASLMCFNCPWGTAQLMRRSVKSLPQQALLRHFGLSYLDGYFGGPYAAGGSPEKRLKTRAAEFPFVLHLFSVDENHPDLESLKFSGGTAGDSCSSAWHTIGHLREVYGDEGARCVVENAVKSSRWVGKVAAMFAGREVVPNTEATRLLVELTTWGVGIPGFPASFPRAASFLVPSFLRVSPLVMSKARDRVVINVTCRRGEQEHPWLPLGAYILPGVPASIRMVPFSGREAVPPLAVVEQMKNSWSFRVGCHTDDLSEMAEWKRLPRVSSVHTFFQSSTETVVIESAVGGMLYLINHDHPGTKPPPPPFTLEITQVACAPILVVTNDAFRGAMTTMTFEDAADVAKRQAITGLLMACEGTTDQAVIDDLSAQLPPYLEVFGKFIAMSLPVTKILSLGSKRLREAADMLDRMCEWHHVLSRRESPEPHAQRLAFDIQISCGCLHSGYPVMAHEPAIDSELGSEETVFRTGSWGIFHEVGHNHQRGGWTFEGTTEVTVNLFTLHAMQHMYGISPKSHFMLQESIKVAKAYMVQCDTAPSPEARSQLFSSKWKNDPFLALTMYVAMIDTFGWTALYDVFAEYEPPHGIPDHGDSWSDQRKRDEFFARFSRRVGQNVAYWVNRFWGIPLSPEAMNHPQLPVFQHPCWLVR